MRLIDADSLEKAIYKWMPKDMETWADSSIPPIENLVVSIMMTIEEQPTVNQWIPVNEGLPKIGEKVLGSFITVCYKGDCKYVDHGVAITKRCGNKSWYGFLDDEIVAWQKLPKPYEVEE